MLERLLTTYVQGVVENLFLGKLRKDLFMGAKITQNVDLQKINERKINR